MWIKICGITRLEDAEAAVADGADAIGFVFAESPRRVTPETARAIADRLPASIEKIGVFVDASAETLSRTYDAAGLTGVQMHQTVFAPVNPRLPGGDSAARPRRTWALRFGDDAADFARQLDQLRPIAGTIDGRSAGTPNSDLNAIMIDTCVSGKQGGSGVAFDWSAARETFRREAQRFRLIAAGGLRPENVGEAIRTLQPWGVDVSSGVEASPGKKDRERIRKFIQAVRKAASELSEPDSGPV